MYDTSTGRWDRGAGLVLAGLLGVSVGMIGGIGYARRYLLPANPPATVDTGGRERSAARPGERVAVTTYSDEPSMPETSALARATEPVIDEAPMAIASRADVPPATQPAAGPARETVRPSPRQVASVVEEPTTRSFELSRDRQLFTCPDASHLTSTTTQVGQCSKCNKQLVSVGTVPHGLQAMMAYDRQSRTPAVTSRAATRAVSTRPARTPPVRAGRALYACRRPEHLAATTNEAGTCSRCGAELVPATTLSHALEIMQYQAAKDQPASDAKPTTSRPALYTCLVREHVAGTTDKPGVCETCQLALLGVERVGHAAQAIQAWEEGRRAVSPGLERTEPSLPALYTCPDVRHVESTGRRPGTCPMCGLGMRSVYEVVHQVDAIRAYVKARAERQARTVSSRPATTQP